MASDPSLRAIEGRLESARRLASQGQAIQAELLGSQILKEYPHHAGASELLAQLAFQRGDVSRGVELLDQAVHHHPELSDLAVTLAQARVALGDTVRAHADLTSIVAADSTNSVAWLLLADVRERLGDEPGALQAQFEAITRAQRRGHWVDESTTPPRLLTAVVRAIERIRVSRRELLHRSYGDVRQCHGDSALVRVDRALAGYLREWDSTPVEPRQRPKFFFFPGLPNTPYHDPYLQPWAHKLQAAFPQIRADALRIVEEENRLPNFVPARARVADYVSGSGAEPSWEAFFFYRHGERYDANHVRCPDTSRFLESIDLCRIAEQAPEILFSVLRPGSHINPHHGVSNVRLVMHLALRVPPDCALNLIDHGEHRWQEGELVMFDDTFLHEAWNRSDSTRIVLLMDCWNPHLTDVERLAVRQLIETITALQLADKAVRHALSPSGRDA